MMNISRFIKEELIVLDLLTEQEPQPEENNSNKWLQRNKERVLSDLVGILEISGKTGNRCKLLTDFVNREKKATTAIGYGVAIPHVRSMQAKQFIIAIARSVNGFNFDSLDSNPTHFFFAMAAPPYDDSLYLRVFKALSESLQYESFREELMRATKPYDIIHAFKQAES
jgi:mannitol/fructose-specific phosphotransferase system IIA component (Ntr-type)